MVDSATIYALAHGWSLLVGSLFLVFDHRRMSEASWLDASLEGKYRRKSSHTL
jgi:hypothetical protein